MEVLVYDVRGRLVRTLSRQLLPAGTHSITWDGTADDGHVVSSGIYWARARWAEHQVEQRMVRVR